MSRLPITAIVIFRNEARLLDGCLAAVRQFCDEVIGVDMQSSDDSRSVALGYVDRLLEAPLYPIAEPTRVAAAAFARHDWILLIDPDEHIPRNLAKQIARAFRNHADAAAIRLPWWYYFKRRRLDGTVWGGGRATKRMLVHRRRCDLLPYCNRIVELREDQHEHTIAHDGHNHIRHHWCDSYRSLLKRHVTRYCHTEAIAQVANGQRFSLRHGIVTPLIEFYRCLRHYDGWRVGLRGWALSTIYFVYILTTSWLVLHYQRRGDAHVNRDLAYAEVPTLNEVPVSPPHRMAA